MDTHLSGYDEKELERRLKAKAVAQARAETGPAVPNQDAEAEMLEMIKEIDRGIAVRLAE